MYSLADYDYELPAELIAQKPADRRDHSRLLRLERATGAISHHRLDAIEGFLCAGDVLVVNDTAVVKARLLGLIVGVSVQVAAPLGQYDGTRLVNIGSNRWFVKTELGVSKALGAWTLEFAPAVTVFTDNDDFYGGRTRAQDPIYAVQGGVIYGFRGGVWVALNGTYQTGGRSSVDGVDGDDLRKNSLVALTVALPINRTHSVKVYASTGLATRVGADADTVGVVWQYRWGGGL